MANKYIFQEQINNYSEQHNVFKLKKTRDTDILRLFLSKLLLLDVQIISFLLFLVLEFGFSFLSRLPTYSLSVTVYGSLLYRFLSADTPTCP